MSRVFLREVINPSTVLAIACSAAGIAMLHWARPDVQAGAIGSTDAWDTALLGNVLVFAAVLCEAAYAVIGKSLGAHLRPKRISALINLWGFALITPLGLWAASRFDFAGVGVGSWALLVYYSLAASVWSVWLWMTGLRRVSAARAGVFTVMLPISAAFTGVIALGESITPVQAMALALGLAGIALATVARPSPS